MLEAMNGWTPSRAANSSADVLRRFVAKNDIPKQQLVAMTAMATHEAIKRSHVDLPLKDL